MIDETFDIEKDIDIDRLARLARIDLTDEDRDELAAELKQLADYIYPRVKNEDIPLPVSYVHSQHTPREDIAELTDAQSCALILANAPSLEDGYITVPKVIKEEQEI